MRNIEHPPPGASNIVRDGFARFDADNPHPVITKCLGSHEWSTFADSWREMPRDTYMADGGRYRRRHYSVFEVTSAAVVVKPHEPHYQALAHNHLNGGIERWFEPVPKAVACGAIMRALLAMCQMTFGALSPDVLRWHAEVHQFRIEADATNAGNPTPEGMHRDGVDYVLVMLVARENIASGITTMADEEKRSLGSFTLVKPGDAVLLDDRRVFHGVTPVMAVDPNRHAYRDVLVVTFIDAAKRLAAR